MMNIINNSNESSAPIKFYEYLDYYNSQGEYEDKEKMEEHIRALNEALTTEPVAEKNPGAKELIEKFFAALQDGKGYLMNDFSKNATGDGTSSTKGYKEIYFNEIIQNANDITNGSCIDIYIKSENINPEEPGKAAKRYTMTFCYEEENGFQVENIVGFFDFEQKIKKNDISSTGKHGVGIKSLFYFIDSFKIESNIGFKISKSKGKMKLLYIELAKEWDKTTRLTISWVGGQNGEQNNNGYNTKKLESMIDSALNGGPVTECFFGEEQSELVFDIRSLLFTDANRGKTNGIKTISFYKWEDINTENTNPLFVLECKGEENEPFCVEDDAGKYSVSVQSLSIDSSSLLEYTVVTRQVAKKTEQNFSVAFPAKIIWDKRRYYETYYIPDPYNVADYTTNDFNILINSKYSSVNRLHLTDDNSELNDIMKNIESLLNEVYTFLTGERFNSNAQPELRKKVSILFHKMLRISISQNNAFVVYCQTNSINNRYLLKFENEPERYITYKSSSPEEYEKKLLGSQFEHEEFVKFVEDNIIQKDSRACNEEAFIDGIISKLYKSALDDKENFALRGVLNIAGDIRSLIYYRISGRFPEDNKRSLDNDTIDAWINLYLWGKSLTKDEKTIIEKMAISLLARYKLNDGALYNGEVRCNSSSFYTYLFSSSTVSGNEATGDIPPFARAANEQYNNTKYQALKEELLSRLVSRCEEQLNRNFKEKTYSQEMIRTVNDIPIFYSYHHMAGNEVFFCDFYHIKDAQPIGHDSLDLLIEILNSSSEIWNHIKSYGNILLLCSNTLPTFGELCYQNNYDGRFWLTGEWHTTRFIDISFLRELTARSWADYKTYANFYINCESFKSCPLSSRSLIGDNISVGYDELKDMFEFFYKNEWVINALWRGSMSISLSDMSLSSSEDKNAIRDTCPGDVHDFLKNVGRIDVKVMEINPVRGKSQEILFCYNSKVFIKTKDGYQKIATISGLADRSNLLIIHSASWKCDYSQALTSVLSELGNNDVLERFKAFIPTGTKDSLSREDYSKIQDSDIGVCNPYSQQYEGSIPSGNLSAAQLLKLIMARGNNNNCCCCCGESVEEENARLIITYSGGLVYEAGCSNCVDILRKTLSKTVVDKENHTIDYVCVAENQHQKKEKHIKHKVNDGVWKLNFFDD